MERRFVVRNASVVGPDIVRFVVEAPRVAEYARPGQFVIVRGSENGERIPLTICQSEPHEGTITLVVQGVGRSTIEINAKVVGDHFADILGPLGVPTHIAGFGRCVVVAGGVGVAIALPVAHALAQHGNTVVGIVGARGAAQAILIDEMKQKCDEVIVTTEDGSLGRRGLVTDALATEIAASDVDYVFTVGPIPMMAAVAEMTRIHGISTVASLNPIMVDGTGMCGGCRVNVGGEAKFACIDGPEFDAHSIDFAGLRKRNEAYRAFEDCQLHEVFVVVDG